jgi:hypothetical protein
MTEDNYAVFRECLSNAIVSRSEKPKAKRRKGKRNERKDIADPAPERADPEELAEFVDVHLPSPNRRNQSLASRAHNLLGTNPTNQQS